MSDLFDDMCAYLEWCNRYYSCRGKLPIDDTDWGELDEIAWQERQKLKDRHTFRRIANKKHKNKRYRSRRCAASLRAMKRCSRRKARRKAVPWQVPMEPKYFSGERPVECFSFKGECPSLSLPKEKKDQRSPQQKAEAKDQERKQKREEKKKRRKSFAQLLHEANNRPSKKELVAKHQKRLAQLRASLA